MENISILLISIIFLRLPTPGHQACVWSECGAKDCKTVSGHPYVWATSQCGQDGISCFSGSSKLWCCDEPNTYKSTYWSDCSVNYFGFGQCYSCGQDECVIPNHECEFGDCKALCGKPKFNPVLKGLAISLGTIGGITVTIIAAVIGGAAACYCCKCHSRDDNCSCTCSWWCHTWKWSGQCSLGMDVVVYSGTVEHAELCLSLFSMYPKSSGLTKILYLLPWVVKYCVSICDTII